MNYNRPTISLTVVALYNKLLFIYI